MKNVTPPAELALIESESGGEPPKRLKAIAKSIKAEWGKGIEAQFAIGHLLVEANALMPATQDFGKWLDAQEFGFSRQTAGRLRDGAEREPEVRAFIADRSRMLGRDVGLVTAVALLNATPDDRQPKERVKAMQELVGPEPETSGFVKFREAALNLNVSQLATEELVEFAGLVKDLAGMYSEERRLRQARTREV